MSDLEKFREAEPLEDVHKERILGRVLRTDDRGPLDRIYISLSYTSSLFTVRQARALRDWLTEVLP